MGEGVDHAAPAGEGADRLEEGGIAVRDLAAQGGGAGAREVSEARLAGQAAEVSQEQDDARYAEVEVEPGGAE